MILLQDLSIKRKLMVIITLTSTVALLLASAAFVTYDFITFRRATLRDVRILANIIGNNCTAPMTFDRPDEATEFLHSLKAESHIMQACIYRQEEDSVKLFAAYTRPDLAELQPPPPEPDGHRFAADSLIVFASIVLKGERIGVIHIRSDLEELHNRLRRYAGIVALVMLAAGFVAFLLSTFFQRLISKPVLRLAEIARTVSNEKNYSVRATDHRRDELGILIRGFNEMLAQIEVRDEALQRAQYELERRVEERTRELQQEIVERKRAESALAEQAKELTRSNEELEQFAYVASHDLQEPLRMVSNYTQLLARRYRARLDADADEFIHYAVDGANRMQILINDLLAYSRVGTRGHEFAPVDLNEVMAQVLVNLRQAIDEKKAEVTLDALPTLHGDQSQLLQLFQNLIGNAIKFHGPQPPRVQVGVVDETREWHFFVRDNGIGIDPQYADRIFVIFQRLHGYSEYPGTGIGLAICKKIVERHRGRIGVESEPGQGSTFHFTIAKR